MSNRWRVIIVGGGFGGLRAAQALKSAHLDARTVIWAWGVTASALGRTLSTTTRPITT